MRVDTSKEITDHLALMTRPTPGMSLTKSPDSPDAWEKPPQFTVPKEAAQHVYETLIQPENHKAILKSLIDGTTVLELTQIILFAGYYNGKFNPDLMLMLMEPTIYMIMALAEKARIDYLLDEEDDPADKNRVGYIPTPDVNLEEPPSEVEEILEDIKTVETPSLLEKVE
tara:strand:+ start:5568 stop:6077 length:510 start_codon:yes stop_codon:yes gene_type:complete